MWRNAVVKKVIQVPVDEKLLTELDIVSKKQSEARSEIIRRACRQYLDQVESEEMDRQYQQGYRRMPEDTGVGEVQLLLTGEILPEETW
jgi:metal-responsive CopG/Arc/MetJ family transcriptional regulator